MRTLKLFVAMTVLLVLAACGTKKNNAVAGNSTPIEEVKFEVANRYFLRNDAVCKQPKITTQEEFENTFGMATIMGPNGQPTPIDFNKQFVIAVTEPEINAEVRMTPVTLQRSADGTLTFIYESLKERDLSFTTQPLLIVIVDKKDDTGKVVVKKTVLM